MKVDLTNVLIVAAIGGVAYYLWAVDAKKRGRFDTKWGKAASPPSALAKQQRPLQADYERDLVDSRGYYEEKLALCAELRDQPPDKKYGRWTYREGAKSELQGSREPPQENDSILRRLPVLDCIARFETAFTGTMSASYSINKKIAQDGLTRSGIELQARKAAADSS